MDRVKRILRVTANEIFLREILYTLKEPTRTQAFEFLDSVKLQQYYDGKEDARLECEKEHGL